MVDMGKGFSMYRGLYDKLYDHQKTGILFLWKLRRSQSGGILADDMGLGKTIQVIGFLAGLYDMEKVRTGEVCEVLEKVRCCGAPGLGESEACGCIVLVRCRWA